MVEVDIVGVTDTPNHHVVILRHEDRVLPIVVGTPEAQAIYVGLHDEKLGRPMTHDLVCNLLAGLRAELESVTIYKLENDTFFAHLNVKQASPSGETEQMLRIDARPSDGIAIAVRRRCPIYVADEVMESAAQDESSVEHDENGDADTED